MKLYADYCDWPVWCSEGNLPEHALPLSDELKHRIRAWFNAYDEPPRPGWPLWTAPGGLDGDEAERAWEEEGEAIRTAMEQELECPVAFET